MLLARITLCFPRKIAPDTMEGVRRLVSAWQDGGQVLSESPHTITSFREVSIFAAIPERAALSPKNSLWWTTQILAKLRERGMKMTIDLQGGIEGEPWADTCSAPRSYVLFTHLRTIAPPVRCGRCFLPVPIYRLPPNPAYDKHEPPFLGTTCMHYKEIHSWQRNFRRMGPVVDG